MKKTRLILWLICSICIFDVFSNYEKPKIYDCFMFYNEFELLEIKLNELYEHVDYFVIVEALESHRGYSKPLYFNENRDRFAKFSDKIIHVVADCIKTDNPWVRENFQRNEIRKGIAHINNWDIVIVEDLDEIIRPSKIDEIVSLILDERVVCVCCSQSMYNYNLNRCSSIDSNPPRWDGSAVMKFGDLKKISPQKLRERRHLGHVLDNAGWHFSYMGGLSRVIQKLENFAHSELDTEAFKNEERIRKDIEAMQVVKIDETYPRFVQENIDYLKSLGFIAEEKTTNSLDS